MFVDVDSVAEFREVRDALGPDPTNTDLLKALFRLCREAARRDEAWTVARALCFLGHADEDERTYWRAWRTEWRSRRGLLKLESLIAIPPLNDALRVENPELSVSDAMRDLLGFSLSARYLLVRKQAGIRLVGA